MKTILLTGFPVWGEEQYNSSWEVLESLTEMQLPSGWLYSVQCLPGSWVGSPRRLRSCITPDVNAVICLGMTGGNEILVERIASNLIAPGLPDMKGNPRSCEFVVRDGPPAYFTGLPFREIISAVRAHGINCNQSRYAGDYLCNFIFYRLMHFIAEQRPDIVGGFVHVPPFEMHGGISKTEQCTAVRIITRTVAMFAGQGTG